jgi:hypothetical protein
MTALIEIQYNCPTFTYPPTRKLSVQVSADNETQMRWIAIMNEVLFLMSERWHADQEIRHVAFQ